MNFIQKAVKFIEYNLSALEVVQRVCNLQTVMVNTVDKLKT